MAARITEFVLDCLDPERLAAFWCEVLGFTVLDRNDDEVVIGPVEGARWTLLFSRSTDPRNGKLRLHFDINATDRDQDDELHRLLELGAKPAEIGQTGAESWYVLADPEGNEFCLLRSRVDP
jgi:catechol 2,3-dioxygenase-like lactoylglutathione lyase family enzyme